MLQAPGWVLLSKFSTAVSHEVAGSARNRSGAIFLKPTGSSFTKPSSFASTPRTYPSSTITTSSKLEEACAGRVSPRSMFWRNGSSLDDRQHYCHSILDSDAHLLHPRRETCNCRTGEGSNRGKQSLQLAHQSALLGGSHMTRRSRVHSGYSARDTRWATRSI